MAPSSKESEPSAKIPRARAAKVGGKKKRGGATSGTRRGNGAGSGEASGEGWGGPAKGASAEDADRPLQRGGPGRGHVNEERQARNERWVEEILQFYYAVMMGKKVSGNQLSSATHLINRIEGMPIAKTVTEMTHKFAMMTPEEKRAEIARIRARRKAAKGDA